MGVMTAITVGSALVGAGLSFNQAKNARRAQTKADADAAKFLASARSRAEKDYFASLNVPLDAYEAELENNLQTTTTAIEALQEGDARALAAGVGKVGAQSAQTAEQTRIAMGQEMFGLDKLKAENKDDMNQQLIGMDAAAAQDAAKRAADADIQVAQATQSGIGSLTSGLMAGLESSPLYGKSKADRELMSALGKKGITMAEYTANPDKFPNILGRQNSNVLPPTPNSGVPYMSAQTQGPSNSGGFNLSQLPDASGFTTPGQRRGVGPMQQRFTPGPRGLDLKYNMARGLTNQNDFKRNQQNSFDLQGYMGNEIAQLYNPQDFSQRLNKFGVNDQFDYLKYLQK